MVAAATWEILGRNDGKDDDSDSDSDSDERIATGSCAAKTVEFTTRLNGASQGTGRYETCAASENGRPGSHPGLVYGGIGWCRGGAVVFWVRRATLVHGRTIRTDGCTPALAHFVTELQGSECKECIWFY